MKESFVRKTGGKRIDRSTNGRKRKTNGRAEQRGRRLVIRICRRELMPEC